MFSGTDLAGITALLEALTKAGALGVLLCLIWLNSKRDQAQTETWKEVFSKLLRSRSDKHMNGSGEDS